MKDVAAATAGVVGDLASTAGWSVTAKGLWQERQTFVLPLPDDDLEEEAQGVDRNATYILGNFISSTFFYQFGAIYNNNSTT